MEMTFLQDTECWEHFGYPIYGGIQKDPMCSFRKEAWKKPENPKPESPGSPLFCEHHTGTGMEDGRSTRVLSLYGQISQGQMADFLAFIASKSFHL